MKKIDAERLVSALILVAFGILVAILGPKSRDLYLGILCIVSGVGLLIASIMMASTTKVVPFVVTFFALALLTFGICSFTDLLSFQFLITFVILAIGALGLTFIIHGACLLGKKATTGGVLEIVLGTVAVTFTILFFAVTDFQPVVWVVLGILIALYGLAELIAVFSGKELIKKK